MKTIATNGTAQAKSIPLTAKAARETASKAGSQPEKSTPAHKSEEPDKPEVSKSEIREQLKQEKAALNLESTLKLVEELHRRKIQRDKLLNTISTLEEFEVAQQDDAEETGGNYFQGCELIIRDDKRREFATKNPYIIKMVAGYINALCVERLAEIESGIYIPA